MGTSQVGTTGPGPRPLLPSWEWRGVEGMPSHSWETGTQPGARLSPPLHGAPHFTGLAPSEERWSFPSNSIPRLLCDDECGSIFQLVKH